MNSKIVWIDAIEFEQGPNGGQMKWNRASMDLFESKQDLISLVQAWSSLNESKHSFIGLDQVCNEDWKQTCCISPVNGKGLKANMAWLVVIEIKHCPISHDENRTCHGWSQLKLNKAIGK